MTNLGTKIKLFCDGSSMGNEQRNVSLRKGGWSFKKYVNGELANIKSDSFLFEVTNNRAELLAAINALKSVQEFYATVELCSDSQYVQVTIENKKQREASFDGRTYYAASGKPAKNSDLIRILFNEIDRLAAINTTVRFVKVKGHSDCDDNNDCDRLATEASGAAKIRL